MPPRSMRAFGRSSVWAPSRDPRPAAMISASIGESSHAREVELTQIRGLRRPGIVGERALDRLDELVDVLRHEAEVAQAAAHPSRVEMRLDAVEESRGGL